MESVTKVVRNMGLQDREAEVYLYLAKESPKKAREISHALNVDRVQLYRLLKSLQNRGMIESTFRYPASFIAVPFEKVLDLQIKAKKEEARILEEDKKNLVSQLNSYKPEANEVGYEKFMVIEGGYINSRIAQMILEAKKELSIVTSGYGVIQAYRSGLLDYGFDHPLKEVVHFRFLTSLSTVSNHIEVTKELLRKAEQNSLCFESHISDFGAGYFPRFIIRDGQELFIYLKMAEDTPSEEMDIAGLWTNNHVLVHAFTALFEGMWRNSKDILEAISEQESNPR